MLSVTFCCRFTKKSWKKDKLHGPLDSIEVNAVSLLLQLKSVRVHFAYGSDGRSFFVEYS